MYCMNFALILAGGAGDRIGSSIPKQYHIIAGKPVIDYVVEACSRANLIDKIAVVMDNTWQDYSYALKSVDAVYATPGNTRHKSLYNGLREIKKSYACEKIIILDAVSPFVYPELIDEYIELLDKYDSVITAQHITGGFTDIYNNKLDREKYIITQSPEGFRFELLYDNFDLDFPYQEVAGMLPEGSTRKYYYGFKNNIKLTYDYELGYADYMMTHIGNNDNNVAFLDRNLLVTVGLKSFLLRHEKEKTIKWLDEVYKSLPRLIKKWEITSIEPNQTSLYGLVLYGNSAKYGDVIIKLIPGFVGRYERELEAVRMLPQSYMCKLYDWDLSTKSMLFARVNNPRYASFDENIKLSAFFTKVIRDAIPYTPECKLKYITKHVEDLKKKLANIDTVKVKHDEIKAEMEFALDLYNKTFKDSELYIVHGDLHAKNVLDDGKTMYGIDPNGFIAPIELECVRFIRNDVRDHASFGYKARYELLLDYFARFVDKNRLNKMFIIDMALCTFNSVFENEDDKETCVDLELIHIAKEHMFCTEAVC